MKACLKAILLCVFLAVGFSSYVPAVELEGEIVVDTVWSKSLSPYILTDDVIIEEDVTLTIEPGVVVQFEKTGSSDGYHLEVRGTLRARGVENDPILFTIDDLEYNWGHIEFTSTSTPWESTGQTGCIMEYCILEYGGNGRVDARERAAIRIISASPLIQNNVIRYSKNDGIRSVAGFQNLTGNRVHDTTCGIKVIDPESGYIFNNYLVHNKQAIFVESGDNDVEVRNNTILTASEEGHGAALGINLGFHDTLASYAWEQLSGTQVSISDQDLATPTPEFSAPDVPGPEALVFQVTVTDESGLQAVDTVQINVGWDNAAPVANAGDDQTVDPGDRVTLDATDSFDNDDGDDILTYEWLQTSGPDVGLPPGSDPRFASFVAPTPTGDFGELLVFQMTVTDNGGLENIDTVVVRVNSLAAVDDDPTADAGPDQPIDAGVPVNVGDTVTLDGSGSDDTDGTIVSYQWEAIDEYIEFLDPPVSVSPTVRFVAPAPDDADSDGRVYEFKLTVTDNFGNSSTDNVIINVTDPGDPANGRPTARAGADQNGITEGTIVTLDGAASFDPEDTLTVSDIVSYIWEQIAGSKYPGFGNINEDDPVRTVTVPEVSGNDTFVYRLTVTDSGGLQHTDTTSVNITWTNDPPTAVASSDQDAIAGDKVQLKGSESTDPDDGIENYTWTQIGGPVVDLSSSTSAKVWFIAPDVASEEVLVFRLMVEDVNGLISNDVTHVTVSPATSGPTADAGSVSPVAFGATVMLDGTGSSDPDGDIVSYLWEQTKKIDDPSVALLSATTTTPQFTAPAAAEDPFITLTFQLTVTDAEDQVSIDTVLVNVRDDTQVSDTPIANAGPDQSATVLDDITLNASRSYDPDTNPDITVSNNYVSYDTVFEETSDTESTEEINPGNLVGISSDVEANSNLSFSTNFLLNVDGNYSLHLFAWEQTDTQTLNLSDNWWGTTSNEEIANLIFDQTFDPGLPEVIFQASMAEVSAGANLTYPPIAEAGDDLSKDPDKKVTLSCSGFHNPDDIFTYEWIQKEGKTVALKNADQCSATFIAPEISDESEDADDDRTLIFELKVTDAYGFYDTDEVQVTINEIDDDDSDTHSTSGCFVSTIGNK